MFGSILLTCVLLLCYLYVCVFASMASGFGSISLFLCFRFVCVLFLFSMLVHVIFYAGLSSMFRSIVVLVCLYSSSVCPCCLAVLMFLRLLC